VDPNGEIKLADFGMAKHVSISMYFINMISRMSSMGTRRYQLFYRLIIIYFLNYYACISSNSQFFLQQVTAFSTMLSFKGSPYWMAPEVVLLFYLFFITFLWQVVQWKAIMLLQLIENHIMLPFFSRL